MKINHRFSRSSLIVVYLVAIVSANAIVSKLGPNVSIFTAFFFIGLNITTRDYLHEIWQGNQLKRNMFLLILAGSVLSLFFNAGKIALASFAAFALSETVDAICYQLLKNKDQPHWLRINGSNTISSIIDSFVFPYLAFGGFLPVITAGQIIAKIGGGFLWWGVANFLRATYKRLLTPRAVDEGDSAAKINESSLEVSPVEQADTKPALRN